MERKVRDIMVPIEDYPTVAAGSTVRDAVGVLAKAALAGHCPDIATVLVTDNNKLIGTIGFKELLQTLDPVVFKGGTYRGWTVSAEWSPPLFLRGLFTEKCSNLAGRSVEEIMSPPGQLLDADDTLIKAVHALVAGGAEEVLVWQDNRAVGMVRRPGIFIEVMEVQSTGGGRTHRVQAAV